MDNLELYVKQCSKCFRYFNGDIYDKICQDCFENLVELNEIRKRRKIAEQNEY